MHPHSPAPRAAKTRSAGQLLATFFEFVMPWLLLVAALWMFRGIVNTLTETRGLDTWILLMFNVNRVRGFVFVFGVLGVVYGLQQRNLRHTAVSQLNERIRVLESALLERKSGA